MEVVKVEGEKLERIADAIFDRFTKGRLTPELLTRLAIEEKVSGVRPYGLDRLSVEDTAAYLGIEPKTLQNRAARETMGLPAPYRYAKKLFWRRSELDAYVEARRARKAGDDD